jgi:hypothetical protein
MIQIKRFGHLRMPRVSWGQESLLQDQEQNGVDNERGNRMTEG